MRSMITLVLSITLVFSGSPAEAQRTDRAVGAVPERPGDKVPVLRPGARPSGGRVSPKGLRTKNLRTAGDAEQAPNEPPAEEDGGVVRTRSKKAGVLDTSGQKKLGFDPKRLGKKTPTEVATDKLANQAEDVIEWKTNFEKGVKCKKLPLNAKIRLDFHEIALGDLTKFISCVTEKNFILTASANKNASVSILSPKPVTVYEGYKAYLSVLEANGLSIVPNGNFLEIVPNKEAKQQGAPIYGVGKKSPDDDRMVTRLLQLEHVEAQEILPVLDKFKTKAADLTVYAPTNTIILTDTGSNILRLLKLIKELDVPVGRDKIWIRPIQYAEAKEMLSLLQTLFGSASSPAAGKAKRKTKSRGSSVSMPSVSSVVGGGGDFSSVRISKMLSDERTNSLILVTSRSSYLRIDRLLRKVDIPIPGEGQIHIHTLENADAEDIAQTLSSLASSAKGKSRSKKKRKGGDSSASRSSSGTLLEGEVKITAYEPTNSLVIESSLKDYLSLRKVIGQLDVRRKQVYVEAIIMEISQNKQRDLGLSGSAGVGSLFEFEGEPVPMLFGVGSLGMDVQGALSTLSSGGGAIGFQGPLLNVAGGATGDTGGGATFSIPAFGFLLKALQTNADVNVLSTPHVLTVENEEAEIQVGKRQPYRSSGFGGGGLGGLSGLAGLAGGLGGASSALGGLGSLGGLGGLGALGGLGSSVQYVDVDLSLKIKPQVNASDFIRLEIDQSIDDIEGFFQDAPITSTRKIKNVVIVRDGQPVVIGGLMRDQETTSIDKVPFLGDIPLIGLAFRRNSKTMEKRNLLLVIVPHVIKDPSDLQVIHDRRRREYREFARTVAQRRKERSGEMDFRKKSGLMETIHTVVGQARTERELRDQLFLEQNMVQPLGPPDTHNIEYVAPEVELSPEPETTPDDEPSDAPAPAEGD